MAQPRTLRLAGIPGLVAGVIGTKRFLYDLWGDAVNTASRMGSQSTPGEIQITRTKYELKDQFVCRRRGTILVKGKGRMEIWYLVGSRSDDARTEPGEQHGFACKGGSQVEAS